MTRTKTRDGADRGRERDRGSARSPCGPPGAPAIPRRRRRRCDARTSRPSLRASVASPASRPAATNARPEPRSPRAASHSAADDERLVEREVVRLGHVDRGQQRDRDEDARRRRRRTAGAPASRAIAQVSGAASAPMSANGARGRPGDVAEERAGTGPGRSTPAASSGRSRGSAGSGRPGSCPPTSAKIQMKSTLKPWPACSVPGDVHVVGRVGVGRVREVRDQHAPGRRGRARTGGGGYARPVQRSTGSRARRPVRMA